jgi:hypothetical protein
MVNKMKDPVIMYISKANMLHTLRQIVNNDEKWLGLWGLNCSFYHQTVTTKQIEEASTAVGNGFVGFLINI